MVLFSVKLKVFVSEQSTLHQIISLNSLVFQHNIKLWIFIWNIATINVENVSNVAKHTEVRSFLFAEIKSKDDFLNLFSSTYLKGLNTFILKFNKGQLVRLRHFLQYHDYLFYHQNHIESHIKKIQESYDKSKLYLSILIFSETFWTCFFSPFSRFHDGKK